MTPAHRAAPPARSACGYAIVGAGVLLMLAPFYFMFVFATHTRSDIFACRRRCGSATTLLGQPAAAAASACPFWRNLGMSLYVGAA